ncbi:MAG TPA: hypothetical protein VK447_03760, partial [Myxococcaceae bacterium]|nr:hypothetical protein [Myxococcaceae bacterium]
AVLFENCLFYTLPTALLLCAAALALHRFGESRRVRDAALYASLLAALVLTRSLFHLAWMGLALGLALWLVPARRAAFAGFALPLLLCLALHVKNLAVFGFFGTSSWLGMNLARVVTPSLPDDEVRTLVREGRLSRFALLAPFEDLSTYRRLSELEPSPPSGIPALDQEMRSTGVNNFNHRAYLEVTRRYSEDVKRVVKLRPGAPLVGWSHALFYFLLPAAQSRILNPNLDRIRRADRLFDVVLYGQFREAAEPPRDKPVPAILFIRETGLWILAAYALALGGGAALLWRRLRARDRGPFTLAWGFLWLTVAYVTAAGILLEVGENNRFRLDADPLALVMVATLVPGWRRRAE